MILKIINYVFYLNHRLYLISLSEKVTGIFCFVFLLQENKPVNEALSSIELRQSKQTMHCLKIYVKQYRKVLFRNSLSLGTSQIIYA